MKDFMPRMSRSTDSASRSLIRRRAMHGKDTAATLDEILPQARIGRDGFAPVGPQTYVQRIAARSFLEGSCP
ncbi:hypothetical protein [Methylorubrum aminovorans]|uniref:hypothetical protein n=1 Tax=Methylorubrum aminovorans TaxID=269069 RepID=UPI001EDDB338|nr:hypothetical protein [Methylorubrum aminovorans]